MAGFTDFHNHLMPAVDDGAKDAGFSAGALVAFRREGVRQVITTPHFDGALTHQPDRLAARLAELDAGWAALRGVLAKDAENVGAGVIRLERAAEVMLNVPDPDLSDARLRLAGTSFALVEYPMLQLPPVNATAPIVHIRHAGYTPVVAHPERYRNLESLRTLRELVAAGAVLQVNAGSFFGDYGSSAQRWALEILGAGLASYVCSDYHARGEPGVARVAQAFAASGYAEQATLLLEVNGARLLEGKMPEPVPPATPREAQAESWWARLLR